MDDALEFALHRRVPQAQALTAATAAIVAQMEGDRARVRELAALARAHPDEVATRQWRQWAAALAWWAGERAEPIPDVPGPMLRPYFLMLRADDGEVDAGEAVALLDEALDTARATSEQFCEAEILRLRSRARERLGDAEGARRDRAAAREVARRQGARALEERVVAEMSR